MPSESNRNPRGAGRKLGSTKGRVKLGISISAENAEWLRSERGRGYSISRTLDLLLDIERRNRDRQNA